MKKLRNTLALLLSLLMLLSVVAVPASAATIKNVKQYGAQGGYVAFGDSIGRGCGSEGFYLDGDGNPLPEGQEPGGQYDIYSMRNVKGAYPTLISEAIGCEAPYAMADEGATFWPVCYPGMTTAVALDLMGIDDDGFSDTKLDYPYYKDVLEFFGMEESFNGARESDTYANVAAERGGCGKAGTVKEVVQKASLITVELGMCDIFYRTYRIASHGGLLAEGAQLDLSSPESIKNTIELAVKEMYFGFDYWKTYYPVLIKTLQEWNPDATIVMVGSFNVVNQLRITDDDAIPLGSIISAITESMNKYYEKWVKEFGGNVKFADIRNTEPYATENDWSLLGEFKDNAFVGTHPSQQGHDYIARQILGTLETRDVTKDIVIDLARFDKVDYVLLDGRYVKNYSMDGYVLTIPNSSKLHESLAIGIKGEDGKIAIQTYTLSYDKDSGYTAKRIYGNNDAVGTVEKTGTSLLKILKMLFEKIADLFKGLFKS